MSKLSRAMEMAIIYHHKQIYGEEIPYAVHLSRVFNVLMEYMHPEDFSEELVKDLLCAAWLHDIVEDTSATIEQIHTKFGKTVASLVQAVTNEPGKNRKERHEKTYPKIRNTPHAIVIKLADRIANVEASIFELPSDYKEHLKHTRLNMYMKEHKEFVKALYKETDSLTAETLWVRLYNLFQSIDLPEEYQKYVDA